jgi:L-lysine 2,3-aminomutase
LQKLFLKYENHCLDRGRLSVVRISFTGIVSVPMEVSAALFSFFTSRAQLSIPMNAFEEAAGVSEALRSAARLSDKALRHGNTTLLLCHIFDHHCNM